MSYSKPLAGMLAAVILALGVPLCAEEAPPLYQGFAPDSILYGEIEFTGDLRALSDLDAWEKAGAIGIGYADLAARLRRLNIVLGADKVRSMFKGIKRVAGALIDVTIEADPTWLTVIDHEEPQVWIDALKEVAKTGIVSMSETKDGEQTLYAVQVPTDWTEVLNPWAMQRRMWGWGGPEIDTYTDPITLVVWNSRYIILGGKANDVKDALEFYTYGEEDFSLAGSRQFKDAWQQRSNAEFFLYWNIYSTVKKLERAAPMMRKSMGEGASIAAAISDIDQFRYLSMSGKLDAKTGSADFRFKLSFENAPGWLDVIRFPSKAPPLTDFCPPEPGSFASAVFDTPATGLERLKTFVQHKSEAVGHPEFARTFNEGFTGMKDELGFGIDDLLSHIGGEQASFTLCPYDGKGNTRRGEGRAIVIRVKDEAKAEAFIAETLSNSENEALRAMFHHTAGREFVDLGEGKRAGYTVMNAMDPASWAFTVLDGCVVLGNQDAVREAIVARRSGKNLSTDARFRAFREQFPDQGLMYFYSDLGYLSRHANAVTGAAPAEPDYTEWGFEDSDMDVPVRPELDDERLGAEILSRHFANFRMASSIAVDERSISVRLSLVGLPAADGVTDIVLRSSGYANRSEARRQLQEALFPALGEYLFKNGDLPENIEDFAAKGGDRNLFRDPTRAGPAVEKPSDAQSFTWLGRHGDRPLLPAVPLAHSRDGDADKRYLLLMSDGSVHRVAKEQLDAALGAAGKNEAPPFKSIEPQTLNEAGEMLLPMTR